MGKKLGIKYHIIADLLKFNEISPADFIKKHNYKAQSVYSAFRALKYEGIIYISRKHGRNTLYKINREKAKEYLTSQPKILFNLGGGPRTPGFSVFRRLLDLDSVVFVGQWVGVDLDGFQADLLRGSGLFSGGGRRDRACQVSYSQREFSLTLSKHGFLRVYFKSPDAVGAFVGFLKRVGFDDFNVQVVLERILAKLDRSHVEVEIPVKGDMAEFKVETRVGDCYLVSSFVKSHFPRGEIEVKGSALLVQNFISVLAGVQHFSVLDYAIFSEISKLNKSFLTVARGLRDVVDALEKSAKIEVSENTNSEKKEKREVWYYV